MTPIRITRLTLSNFRSYRMLQVTFGARPVVLAGPNGAGKTNLLEAISFLSPGRGLRRATLEAIASTNGDGSWAVAAEVEGALGLTTLGTGIEAPGAERESETRKCRIDREPVGSATAFLPHLSIVWLVPAMDGLFTGPAAERRRFLDRLALTVDAGHGTRVNALERSLRSRNRLLEDHSPNAQWLDAVEHETAELAVAVAAGRREAVRRLADALASGRGSETFPAPLVALEGWMEGALDDASAIAVEDRYRALLRENRPRDAAAGRTLDGPHLSDLRVVHAAKNLPAADASTGEQKALLIGLVLAQADLVAALSGHPPVLLLDDVVAYLDPARRLALYDRLDALGAQVFMTGADPAAFADIAARADVFEIAPGRATPRTQPGAS
jgi:DNA replication and repair protein RecF